VCVCVCSNGKEQKLEGGSFKETNAAFVTNDDYIIRYATA